jgi:hypothetical protein
MNDRMVLLVERDLADDLAIELAQLDDLEVQVGDPDGDAVQAATSGERGDRPLYSLDFDSLTTLIVTLAASATSFATLAQSLLEFVRSRRTAASAQPSIVVNNTFIVAPETENATHVLAAYLQENDILQIAVTPSKPKV